jgi:hypothetical protein
MNRIPLHEAVREIQIAVEDAEKDSRKPFFFIAGAGISEPHIPLAGALQKRCEDEAVRQKRPVKADESGCPLERYSCAFDAAYPHAVARQRFLRGIIESSAISPANLRLAHLLQSGAVASIAVTPNFDDLLTRALRLLGQRTIRVCDHPATVDRINHESDKDLQVIHVHGTYWFYDQCNLKGELGDRARASQDTAFTMVGLLDRILANRSPLVVGYSGWEGDVIMTALRRRLHPNRRLPYRLYWFCHTADAVRTLPEWLVHHPDVYFVFHPHSRGLQGPPFARRASDPPPRGPHPQGEAETPLTAETVYEQMIRALKLAPPRITEDPLHWYADYLKESLGLDGGRGPGDVYSIGNIIEAIERVAPMLKAEPLLDPMRQAVRRAEYADAIELAEGVWRRPSGGARLDDELAAELVNMLFMAARGVGTGRCGSRGRTT